MPRPGGYFRNSPTPKKRPAPIRPRPEVSVGPAPRKPSAAPRRAQTVFSAPIGTVHPAGGSATQRTARQNTTQRGYRQQIIATRQIQQRQQPRILSNPRQDVVAVQRRVEQQRKADVRAQHIAIQQVRMVQDQNPNPAKANHILYGQAVQKIRQASDIGRLTKIAGTTSVPLQHRVGALRALRSRYGIPVTQQNFKAFRQAQAFHEFLHNGKEGDTFDVPTVLKGQGLTAKRNQTYQLRKVGGDLQPVAVFKDRTLVDVVTGKKPHYFAERDKLAGARTGLAQLYHPAVIDSAHYGAKLIPEGKVGTPIRRGIAELAALGPNTITGLYGLGAAGVQAAAGNTQAIQAMGKSFSEDDPIGRLLTHGDFKGFKAHPGIALAEVLGGVKALDNVAGRVSRGGGFRRPTPPDIRSTRTAPYTRLSRQTRYSKGYVTSRIQKARDAKVAAKFNDLRSQARAEAVKGKQAHDAGDLETANGHMQKAKSLAADAERYNPSRVRETTIQGPHRALTGDLERLGDVTEGTNQFAQRAGRNEIESELLGKHAVREKNRRAPVVLKDAPAEVQGLIAEGRVAPNRAELQKVATRLAAQEKFLHDHHQIATNRNVVASIREVLRTHSDDQLRLLGDDARRYARINVAVHDEAKAHDLITHEEAAMSSAKPFAVEQMKAVPNAEDKLVQIQQAPRDFGHWENAVKTARDALARARNRDNIPEPRSAVRSSRKPTAPVAPKRTYKGGAVWRGHAGDQPVKVTGFAGRHDGRDYMTVEGSKTAIPKDELRITGRNADRGPVTNGPVQTSLPSRSEFIAKRPKPAIGTEAPTVESLSRNIKPGKPGTSIESEHVKRTFVGGGDAGFGPEMHGTKVVVHRDAQGKVVGVLRIYLDKNGKPNLLEVAVDPAFRGRGVASTLYRTAERAGYDVESASGLGGLTEAGAALKHKRLSARGEPLDKAASGPSGTHAVELKAKQRRLRDAVNALKAERAKGLTEPVEHVLTLDDIHKAMNAYADKHPGALRPGEQAFISHSSRVSGPGSFNIRADTAKGLSRARRTGAAVLYGTASVGREAMIGSAVKLRNMTTAVKSFRHMIENAAARDPNRVDHLTGNAKPIQEDTAAAAVKRYNEINTDDAGLPIPGFVEGVAVRMNPFGGRAEQLERTLFEADQEGFLPGQEHPITETVQDALLGKDVGKGPWTVLPKPYVDRLIEHSKVSGGGSPFFRSLTNAFRHTVLPFSPTWLAGNAIESVGRAAVAGWRPGDSAFEQKVIDEWAKKDPEAARRFVLSIGTGHLGSVNRIAVRATANSLGVGPLKIIRQVADKALEAEKAGKPIRFGADMVKAYTNWMLDSVNGTMESAIKGGMVGTQMRHLLPADLPAKTEAAVRHVAGELHSNPAAVEELLGSIQRAYGVYEHQTPGVRRLLTAYTPFGAWLINATNFVFHVLPADHPGLVALAAATNSATLQYRRDNGLDATLAGEKDSGQVPPFLQGSIPTPAWYARLVGADPGAPLRLARYTPLGIMTDPTSSIASAFLPQIPLNALQGTDFTGRPLRNSDGTPFDDSQKAGYFTWQLGLATVPIVGMAIRVGQKGPGALNPFQPVARKKTTSSPKTGGWGSASGSASKGGAGWGPAAGSAKNSSGWGG